MKAIFAVPGPEGGVFEYREISAPSPGEVLIAARATGVIRGEFIQRLVLRSGNTALRRFAPDLSLLAKSRQ